MAQLRNAPASSRKSIQHIGYLIPSCSALGVFRLLNPALDPCSDAAIVAFITGIFQPLDLSPDLRYFYR
jgi:hypothetical protein